MQENQFNNTVQSLFKGMDSFLTTKTVVGDAIHIGETIILPLIEVSFGVAAGAFGQDKKNSAGGGLGGKITPSSVLVIQNGTTRLVNVKNQDGITKVLDMVPDFVDKFTSKKKDSPNAQDEKAREQAAEEMKDMLNSQTGSQESEEETP